MYSSSQHVCSCDWSDMALGERWKSDKRIEGVGRHQLRDESHISQEKQVVQFHMILAFKINIGALYLFILSVHEESQHTACVCCSAVNYNPVFYSGCCETTHDHPAARTGLMGRHLQDLALTLTDHLSGTFPRPLTGTKLAKIRALPTPYSPTVHHSKGQHNTIALVLFWTLCLALHCSLYLEQALTLTPILIHTHLSLSITATQVRKQLGLGWGWGWGVGGLSAKDRQHPQHKEHVPAS